MRLGIKGKQVLGVTSIVGVVVVVLSVLHLARLASVSLEESRARAELLANAIYHRAQQVVVGGADPLAALRADPGLRSILESSLYSKNVMYAALVDVHGVAVAHADRSLEGQPLPPVGDLSKLLERSPLSQLRAIYSSQGQNLEFRGPLLLGDTEIGSTRIGVSTLLIRQDLDQSLRPSLVTAFVALAVSVLVATLLSQLFLRPIHMIRSGLTRLGRGEFGVQLDLDQQDEFGELGTSFNAVSEQLLADRSLIAGHAADRESAEAESQLQAMIRYARKLAALGRLSAGVAHEVKNPLNAMMIHLELLRQQVAPAKARAGAVAVAEPPMDRAQAIQHVDVIAREIRRLDEVVQGFLKFARPEDLRLQPLALRPLLDEIVPIVQPEADRTGVQLVVDCDGAPDVNGDPAMLRQAFLNLALNACQAMPNGGTLRIRCESARGRRVAIVFSDTGVGIAPADLQRIFDLYFTTKEKGSGIGLSMVYRTVQMHDGEIEVQSTPGAGTTFRLLFPQA
jgi:signal transduction histidine kinase